MAFTRKLIIASLILFAILTFIAIRAIYLLRTNTRTIISSTPVIESSFPEPIPESLNEEPYKMKVLNIIYIPVNGNGQIDIDETGNLLIKNVKQMENNIAKMSADSVNKLTEASRYHYYKDKSAKPSLEYSIASTKTYYEAIPAGNPVPWSQTARRPDYIKILNRENICDQVDKLGIKEVWLWGYHTDKIEPAESNMSMGSNIKEYWNFDGYGDISNSEKTDDLPVCKNSYVLFNLNYGRGVGEVLENHTHHIENVMLHMDPSLWNSFIGPCEDQEFYGCGWTHYPPNVMRFCAGHDYEWYSKTKVQSDCTNWNPSRTGKKETINCETWSKDSCEDDGGISFKVWWMQNIPGMQNKISYRNGTLINWWKAIGDFDEAIKLSALWD